MNKAFRCFIAIMVALAFVVGVPSDVKATNNDYVYISSLINEILDNGTDYVIKNLISLKDSSGEDKYICYELSPYGYAIYNCDTCLFEEISHYAADVPYESTKEGVCYYFGPQNYYYLVDGRYVHTETGYSLNESEFSFLQTAESQKESRETAMSMRSSTRSNVGVYGTSTTTNRYYIHNSSYFTSLLGNSFGYNSSGTCTAVATAILLGYYDNYYSDSFVPTSFESGYGTTESFHQLLRYYMNPSGGAAGIESAAAAVNQYFHDYGVNAVAGRVIGNHLSVFNILKNKIAAGYPMVTAMFKSYNNGPRNHTVVTYGYTATTVITTGEYVSVYYHTHNGWQDGSNNFITYNYIWFADGMYIY